jgi:hypothetical protein
MLHSEVPITTTLPYLNSIKHFFKRVGVLRGKYSKKHVELIEEEKDFPIELRSEDDKGVSKTPQAKKESFSRSYIDSSESGV